MTGGKPVEWTGNAHRDIAAAVHWYRTEVGPDMSVRFVEAIDALDTSVSAFPSLGSNRYAAQTRVRNLRYRKVERFPYLMFYVEHSDRIQILRVLHESRDIPPHLR